MPIVDGRNEADETIVHDHCDQVVPRVAQEHVGQPRVDATIEDLGCHASQQALVSIFEQADDEAHARMTVRPVAQLAASLSPSRSSRFVTRFVQISAREPGR